MLKDFEAVKEQLAELAAVVNAFKSEAVQLRIVELLFEAETNAEKPEDEDAKPARRKSSRRRKSQGAKASSEKAASEVKTRKPRTRSSSGRPGSKATLGNLYDDGFFKTPKTLKQIVEHCDQNLALKFRQSDFSGALARYVRDKTLKRAKNSDNQYEYSQN